MMFERSNKNTKAKMSCPHKFQNDLQLDRLDFQPETLIVGTFNPKWPEDNYAEWFYGRTVNNYFWDVLPRMYGKNSLREDYGVNDWKSFCKQHKVAITDLIASINDAHPDNPSHYEVISKFKDKKFTTTFSQFEKTDVLNLIKNHASIKAVYFTRQLGVELFDSEIREIQSYCMMNNIYFSNLLTPSGNARYQMGGYKPKEKGLERTLSNFIYENWKEKWKTV